MTVLTRSHAVLGSIQHVMADSAFLEFERKLWRTHVLKGRGKKKYGDSVFDNQGRSLIRHLYILASLTVSRFLGDSDTVRIDSMATRTCLVLSLLYSLFLSTSAVPNQNVLEGPTPAAKKFFFAFGDSYVRPNSTL